MTGKIMKKMMTIPEFAAWTEARRTDYDGDDKLTYDIVALAGEASEPLGYWKKNARGAYNGDVDSYREDILLELGDTLHYLCRVAHDLGYTIEEVADANVEKLINREAYGKGNHGKRS